MKLLVTGGCGFIGSNYIRYLLESTDDSVVNFDKLTYAGHLENLADVEKNPRYEFVKGDAARLEDLVDLFEKAEFDAVVHFAAESHVDRSIDSAAEFIQTNIVGTQNLLELSRKFKVRCYVQVSTDEVYGSLGKTGKFTESTPLAPNSPYSASKAGADLLVRAFVKTHEFPAIITRCCNNYGPWQTPEKLIPLITLRALDNQDLPVYGDGSNVRDWIHVTDHVLGIDAALRRGVPGEVYNIGSDYECPNIEIVRRILAILGKPESLIRFVADRPGHDWRYAIDASKIRSELGWKPRIDFGEGIEQTVKWYIENQSWVRAVQARNRDILDRKGSSHEQK